jgi:predicted Zn-ribbon and HTH transcriptional regulator
MKKTAPPVVPERSQTVREALRVELEQVPRTAADLSSAVGIREKDVAQHLEHLARSLEAVGSRLVVHAAACLACGFEFKKRERLRTPGRCPSCASERIDPPSFQVERPTS